MAQWAAVRYSADHVFDYVEMTRDHSIFETQVPAAWIGKTIVELAVRQKYRINVLATGQGTSWSSYQGPCTASAGRRPCSSWGPTGMCRNS